jgi:hypothetical protein
LTEAETFDIADALVNPVLMNHPIPNFGYRIECSGESLFFTGDHEPFGNPHPVNPPGFAEHQVWIDQRSATIDAPLKNIEALIVDCTYAQAEYPQKTGWGHCRFDSALALAKRVSARHPSETSQTFVIDTTAPLIVRQPDLVRREGAAFSVVPKLREICDNGRSAFRGCRRQVGHDGFCLFERYRNRPGAEGMDAL